ncbi:MAG: polyprenyl diphosphate synthase [Candidatus Woesearchaeota archaeon]
METNYPKHVGIILDGNRRYAKKNAWKPWKGHEDGAKRVEELIEWCQDLDVKELSLFSFSHENFKRPKEEVDFLMRIFEKEFEKLENDKRVYENRVKINFIGRLDLFPENIRTSMNRIIEKTKEHDNYILNFLMGYGGRTEIIDAVKNIAGKVKEGLDPDSIDEKLISESMYLDSEPDLVIRTSEQRLSGFLTWQTVYSEIIFLPDMLWPEFTKEKFVECLEEYSRRKRRFGK